MKAKDYGTGLFSMIVGLVFLCNIKTCETDFKLIEGHIVEDAILHSAPKKQTFYTFKIDKRPYHRAQFSNTNLYSMRSGIDYAALLKRGNTIRTHILKKSRSRHIEMYSLMVDGKEIVPFENRWFFAVKHLLFGLFFWGLGFWIVFD